MTERILNALKAQGIDTWRINESESSTVELFFIRKKLDTRRITDIHEWSITVYRPMEGDLIGSTSVTVTPGTDDEALGKRIADAWYAAQFAGNPAYAMPDAVTDRKDLTDDIGGLSLTDIAGKMTAALFAADTRTDAFINSAELFVVHKKQHILTSWGTDVAFCDDDVNGEFVAQCKEPEDVEMHHRFDYTGLNTAALTEKVAEALKVVCDRAKAQKVLKSGKYTLILTGDHVGTVLGYYVARSSAGMVYSHYSTWKTSEDVQGAEKGEALDLTLKAQTPYNPDGIPMRDLPLLDKGKLLAFHGPVRMCRYLGVEPTGNYRALSCENGTVSFDEMKKTPYLWVVSFSDFQMDEMSGHFGGEIRCAYLFDGETVIPVTGGSVNGNLLEAQKALTFSTDRYTSAKYDGPYALRVEDIPVAGN